MNIYVYSTWTYYDDRINNGKLPWIKIGQTRKEPDIRVKEQDIASTAEPLKILLKIYNVSFTDKDVHRKLQEFGRFSPREDKYSEYYEASLDDVKKAVNLLECGVARPEKYPMRYEQQEAVQKAYDYFMSDVNNVEFLFNCKCRFGKTFASYQLMKKLGASRTLIITYKPAVKDGWKNDLYTHVDFEGYEFVAVDDVRSSNVSTSTVVFGSFQDMLGKNVDNNVKDKWKYVFSVYWDLVIIDECHYGYETPRCVDMMNQLKYRRLLALSGTPVEMLMSGRFTEEQIYTWSYVDEQQRKKNTIGTIEYEHYKDLPKMELLTYNLGDGVFKDQRYYSEEEGLTLSKFFGSEDGIVMKYENSVNRWLDLMVCVNPRKFSSPIFKYSPAHMFWYLSNVNSCKALAKLLRKHLFFQDYKIIVAAGDNEGIGNNTLGIVKRSICKYNKTITLSCGKLNTGVTIPEWSMVFMLTDGKAVETYFQTIFRAQNMCKKLNKQVAYIVDFNPNRAFEMVYDYNEYIAKVGDSTHKSIRRFLDVFNVLCYNDNVFTQADVNSIISQGIKPEKAIKKFESDMIVNINKADDTINSIVCNIDALTSIKKQIIVSSNNIENGKTYMIESDEVSAENKNIETPLPVLSDIAIKNLKARTLNITKQIPTLLYLFGNIHDVNSLCKCDENIFKRHIGITTKEFQYMVRNNFINEKMLNRAIEAFNVYQNV